MSKPLINEIKELNQWGDTASSWIGRLNIVKMSVLSNLINQCNPSQDPSKLFYGYGQADSKVWGLPWWSSG